MLEGMPDRARFRAVVGRAIDQVRAAGFGKVRAFGEMVDILRRTNVPATMRLEELWNELLRECGVALLCGYSLDAFDRTIYRGLRLERAVDRAYAEVFGGGADASGLRRALLQHYARPAAMPDATASILAARELDPTTGDVLLDSVRRHYAAGAARSLR